MSTKEIVEYLDKYRQNRTKFSDFDHKAIKLIYDLVRDYEVLKKSHDLYGGMAKEYWRYICLMSQIDNKNSLHDDFLVSHTEDWISRHLLPAEKPQ